MHSCMRPWFNALKNQIRAGLGTRDGYSKSYKPKPELHQHLFIRAVRTIEGRVGGPIVHPAWLIYAIIGLLHLPDAFWCHTKHC